MKSEANLNGADPQPDAFPPRLEGDWPRRIRSSTRLVKVGLLQGLP